MSTTASQQATIEPSSKFTPEGDTFTLGGKTFSSRLILGSGKFSLPLIKAVAEEGKAQIITLALRRATPDGQENILDFMPKDVTLLPNTSGARTAEEAVRIAELSRAMGCGDFVKVEIISDARCSCRITKKPSVPPKCWPIKLCRTPLYVSRLLCH